MEPVLHRRPFHFFAFPAFSMLLAFYQLECRRGDLEWPPLLLISNYRISRSLSSSPAGAAAAWAGTVMTRFGLVSLESGSGARSATSP